MPTIGEIYYKAIENCKEFGISSADIRLLIAYDENLDQQIDVIYSRDKEMTHPTLFESQYDRLKNGEPVEYIIQEARFLGLKLHVDKRVLIPRGETEELVALVTEKISDYFDPRNYLVCADIGTGSGAITLGLKSAFPHWVMMASDISKDALEVAKGNFAKYKTSVQVVEGDSLAPFIKEMTKIDILVCNPPYIVNENDAQPSVRDYEPGSALWLDKNNSVYEKIFRDIYKVKKGALFMAFEISPDLVEWLTGLMEKYLSRYRYEFVNDLSGDARFLFVYLEGDDYDA